jgi:DNA-binding phage protein
VARRSKGYDEDTAADLEDPNLVRSRLTAGIDAGTSLQDALGQVIRAMGVKEFAEKVGMPSPNVLRAIDPKHNPTLETLERLLKPFGLRVGLAATKKAHKGRASKPRKKSR